MENFIFDQIVKEDINIGQGTASTPLPNGTVATVNKVNLTDFPAAAYAYASLPAPSTAGRIARVTNTTRGLWTDSGTQWIKNFPFVNVRDFGALGNGVTDDTAAIQAAYAAAIAATASLFIPDGNYIVSDTAITCTLAHSGKVCIFGIPFRSILTNKAGGSTPTIVISGCQYWDIRGLVLAGRTGYQNEGIRIKADASSNRSAFGWISDIMLQPNGVGIHITDCNTATIQNCQYWPSGFIFCGATATAANLVNGILADGATAVNEIIIRSCNFSPGYVAAASGGAAIKWNTATVSDDVNIEDCELEGTDVLTNCSISLTNVFHFSIKSVYADNTQVRFTSSRNGHITIKDGATAAITLTGCAYMTLFNLNSLSLTADVTTASLNLFNVTLVSYSNAATDVNVIGLVVSGSGGYQKENLGSPLGFTERGRAVSVGNWTAIAYSAGNFTSPTGTWVVQNADQLNFKYMLVGKTLFLQWSLTLTTVTGTPAYLKIALPTIDGVQALVANRAPQFSCQNAQGAPGAGTIGLIDGLGGDAYLSIYFDQVSSATTWVAGVNNTSTIGSAIIEIQ